MELLTWDPPWKTAAALGCGLACLHLSSPLRRNEGVSGKEGCVSFLSLGAPLPSVKSLGPFPHRDHSSGQESPVYPVCRQPPSFLSSQFPQLLQSWKPWWWLHRRVKGGWGGARRGVVLPGEHSSQPMASIFC